jgi:hypothetical protein
MILSASHSTASERVVFETMCIRTFVLILLPFQSLRTQIIGLALIREYWLQDCHCIVASAMRGGICKGDIEKLTAYVLTVW